MTNCLYTINRRDCESLCVGEGWFSKITSGKVDAQKICKDLGYINIAEEYGENGGRLCHYPGRKYGSPILNGGSINKLGDTVSWRCSKGKQ